MITDTYLNLLKIKLANRWGCDIKQVYVEILDFNIQTYYKYFGSNSTLPEYTQFFLIDGWFTTSNDQEFHFSNTALPECGNVDLYPRSHSIQYFSIDNGSTSTINSGINVDTVNIVINQFINTADISSGASWHINALKFTKQN